MTFLTATAIAIAPHAAIAQTWPSKPIRAVIPFAAGSLTDVLPRVVFDQVGKQLGQTIVVENRTGAGGTIGIAAVAQGRARRPHASSPIPPRTPSRPRSIPTCAYDTARDLTGGGLARAVAAGDDHGAVQGPQDGAGLRQGARRPSRTRSTSPRPASGTATHLAAERFIHAAGIKAVHIPHRGGAEALTDVIAGRVDFYFCPIGTAVPQISDGRVLALAVSQPEARRGAARRAVDARGRLCGFRLHVLGRRVRSGQDAGADRRPPAPGNAEGHAGRGGEERGSPSSAPIRWTCRPRNSTRWSRRRS